MNTLVDTAKKASYSAGHILIQMTSGVEVRFPVADNPRLSKGTSAELSNIEVSPFGLHWPDLDEDLSYRGILEGNFGQRKNKPIGAIDVTLHRCHFECSSLRSWHPTCQRFRARHRGRYADCGN